MAVTVSVTNLPPGSAWSITLSDGSVISGTADASGNGSGSVNVKPSSTTTYTIASMTGYLCAVLTGSMDIAMAPCCVCDMRTSEYGSSTDWAGGIINGSLHLNSGSKKVVDLEISTPYFDYNIPPGCDPDCHDFMTGYRLGNFIAPPMIAGGIPRLAGCFGSPFSREIDWHYNPAVNIDETIKYTITIPKTSCPIEYEYCIKVLVHYDDCSMCECTICFKGDKVVCSCERRPEEGKPAGTGAKMNNSNVEIFPNPNGGQFTVTMDKSIDSKVITVVDMSGKLISKSVVNGDVAKLDISRVPAGVYSVIVAGSGNVVTKKVVVTK